jgi:hypothetical protein
MQKTLILQSGIWLFRVLNPFLYGPSQVPKTSVPHILHHFRWTPQKMYYRNCTVTVIIFCGVRMQDWIIHISCVCVNGNFLIQMCPLSVPFYVTMRNSIHTSYIWKFATLVFSSGVHKFPKTLGALPKFFAPGRWYESSFILMTDR